jgi:predicted MFS family arabinose efflux permease
MRLRRNPAFVVFWSARTISFAGTGITTVVLPVLVYEMTHSPAWVATVGLIEFLPYLAFGLLAGAVADRVNRKKLMVGCDATAALLLVTVPVTAALHLLVIAQLLIVALGIATVYVWFDAANFGTLPALVDRAELPVAASLMGSTAQVALLCAPTAGAALLAVMSPPYALGFDAASYLISALLLLSIRRSFARPQPERDSRRIRADIAEGLRFLWQQPVIRTMTFSVTCVCLSWGGMFALLVVYANRALHLTHVDVRLGLLYSAGELGGLFAAAAVPMLIKRLPIGPTAAAFLTANAAALAFLAVAPSYGWALLALFLDEFTYLIVLTTGITLRQMLTPDHLQARVNTAGRMLAGAGLPIGAALGGFLAESLPIRLTFGLLTISAVAGAGLAGWSCLGSGPLAAVSVPVPEPVPVPDAPA